MRRTHFLLFGLLTSSCSPQLDRASVFQDYTNAVNNHAVGDALALHTSDAEFLVPGQPPIRGTKAMRSSLHWDSVPQTHISFRISHMVGDTLILGPGSEGSLWFQGIGLDSITYAAGTRVVFEGGLITGVHPSSLLPESRSELQTRFDELMDWAARNAAEEIALLLPEGSFRYDPEHAITWLALLARYAAREEPDLP